MFKRHRENKVQVAADSLYAAIVAQARQPGFYRDLGVPDTLDGRFDLLVMHAFLLFHRLKGEGETARNCAQLVFDTMFSDLDQNLREMGVGDMSIGKKVRKMGAAFYGRTNAYNEGLMSYQADPEPLTEAIRRNIFPEAEDGGASAVLAGYMTRCVEALEQQDVAQMLAGRITFPEAAFHDETEHEPER